MKTVQKTKKTPKQVSAHEYRNELGFLRHVMEKTGFSPAEIAEGLKRMGKPGENEAFRKWLENAPDVVGEAGADVQIPLTLQIDLHLEWWANLQRIALVKGGTLEETASDLLATAIETFEDNQRRAEQMREATAQKIVSGN